MVSLVLQQKLEHLRYDGDDTSRGLLGDAAEEEERDGAAVNNAACSFLLMVRIKKIL